MLLKYAAAAAILVTGWLVTSAYIGFLRRRAAIYRAHTEFLLALEDKMRRELCSLSLAAANFPFSEHGWNMQQKDGAIATNKYLTKEESQGFLSLITEKSSRSLEREIERVRTLRGLFEKHFANFKEKLGKDIKVAVVLYCGAACGLILLIL